MREIIYGILDDAVSSALIAAPREMCGVAIVKDGKPKFIECRNIGNDNDFFYMHPQDYVEAANQGEVIAIVHSHGAHSTEPSDADLTACEKSRKPWLIVNTAGKSTLIMPTGYKAPLIGRTWAHGVHDCYSLLRDSLLEIIGTPIIDFERGVNWWERGENLIVDQYEKAGFKRLLDHSLKHGDVLIMQVGSKVPNHCAVWLDGNYILHHCANRLSSRDVYGASWQRLTVLHLRHVSKI